MALIDSIKPLEYPFLFGFRNADTRIGHTNKRMLFFITCCYGNTASLSIILDGVFTDVIDHFIQYLPHTLHGARCSGHLKRNLPLFTNRLQAFLYIFRQFQQIDGLPSKRNRLFIQLRQLNNITNQGNQPLGFIINLSGKVGDICRQHDAIFHDFCNARNGSQRCFQFMRNICSKFSAIAFLRFFFRNIQNQNDNPNQVIFLCLHFLWCFVV